MKPEPEMRAMDERRTLDLSMDETRTRDAPDGRSASPLCAGGRAANPSAPMGRIRTNAVAQIGAAVPTRPAPHRLGAMTTPRRTASGRTHAASPPTHAAPPRRPPFPPAPRCTAPAPIRPVFHSPPAAALSGASKENGTNRAFWYIKRHL